MNTITGNFPPSLWPLSFFSVDAEESAEEEGGRYRSYTCLSNGPYACSVGSKNAPASTFSASKGKYKPNVGPACADIDSPNWESLSMGAGVMVGVVVVGESGDSE